MNLINLAQLITLVINLFSIYKVNDISKCVGDYCVGAGVASIFIFYIFVIPTFVVGIISGFKTYNKNTPQKYISVAFIIIYIIELIIFLSRYL